MKSLSSLGSLSGLGEVEEDQVSGRSGVGNALAPLPLIVTGRSKTGPSQCSLA